MQTREAVPFLFYSPDYKACIKYCCFFFIIQMFFFKIHYRSEQFQLNELELKRIATRAIAPTVLGITDKKHHTQTESRCQ